MSESESRASSEVEPVEQLMARIDNDRLRTDARELLALMRRATGSEPRVWNTEMIGFGNGVK